MLQSNCSRTTTRTNISRNPSSCMSLITATRRLTHTHSASAVVNLPLRSRHYCQNQHRQFPPSSRGPFSRAPLLRLTTTKYPTTIIATSTILSRKTHSVAAIQEELFGTGPDAMPATKIDGTAIAKSIRERIHKEIEATQKVNPRYKPSLKIIQGTTTINCVGCVSYILTTIFM